MRRMFMTAVLAGSATFYAVVTQAEENEAAAIARVIADQISAMRADDFVTAFRYASPGIQGIFGTPERFGQMVRNGYPMVWRPSSVEFGELRSERGVTWQSVFVRDQDGAPWELDYQMIEQDGGWQINGVQIRTRPALGV